ncbi:MAG: hypothetical protein NZO58_01980, partial [Gemmataceae bacterium]|nr:hypothetical protein [Gemmataceae bacterium]
PLPPAPEPLRSVAPPPIAATSVAPPPIAPPPVAAASPGSHATMRTEPERVIATSQALPVAPPPLPVANRPPPGRDLPPLRYVNHPEVMVEYELSRVGPSGVGSVDLWWTKNDGQTWELYAVDPESKSGSVRNGVHKRLVYLQDGDGTYGFALVVKSRAGLGKAPPRPGDPPDIRIELDTSAPEAKLYEPQPDPQKANTLLLKWTAVDNNLSPTPITLEWSARREGPWTPITPSPLPNTGRHSWTLPENLPVQVYLRLRVRDLAGNESVAVTQDPQLVDLSEPEGRLTNVIVSPR